MARHDPPGGSAPGGRRPSSFGPRRGLTAQQLAEIYERRAPDVLRFLERRSFAPEIASDLLSETFARALADRERFRGTTEEEAIAWIYMIARNQLIDRQRRHRVEREALRRLGMQREDAGTEAFDEVEREADREDDRVRVASAIGDLPPAQREVLRLRIVEDRSYAEVAETLGTSEQNVRARVSRALRALRASDAWDE